MAATFDINTFWLIFRFNLSIFVCLFSIWRSGCDAQELNLDLVQFPQPVYITEVRIIPLGARVQADFPGGVRLGATNPSKFHIELFVNDLAKPGASAFERLGDFDYNQNDCINLQCAPAPTAPPATTAGTGDDSTTTATATTTNERQIPTDGLVLRGCYTTITLAVYGSLAKDSITDRPSSPPTPIVQVPVPAVETAGIAASAVVVHVPQDALDLKQKNTPTDIEWASETNDISYPKDGGGNYTGPKGISVRSEESLRAPIDGDVKQPYVESWSSPIAPSRAKSPDTESWDNDSMGGGKQLSCIASPSRSSRRSRSPTDHRRSSSKRDWSKSPEYSRHSSSRRRSYDRVGVLDKKLMKSREYETGSHRSPQTRLPRTPSPEAIGSGTRRPPRTPDQRSPDDFKHKVHSPQSIPDESNPNSSSTLAPVDDDAMSQGKSRHKHNTQNTKHFIHIVLSL